MAISTTHSVGSALQDTGFCESANSNIPFNFFTSTSLILKDCFVAFGGFADCYGMVGNVLQISPGRLSIVVVGEQLVAIVSLSEDSSAAARGFIILLKFKSEMEMASSI